MSTDTRRVNCLREILEIHFSITWNIPKYQFPSNNNHYEGGEVFMGEIFFHKSENLNQNLG